MRQLPAQLLLRRARQFVCLLPAFSRNSCQVMYELLADFQRGLSTLKTHTTSHTKTCNEQVTILQSRYPDHRRLGSGRRWKVVLHQKSYRKCRRQDWT
jgi:hypothetical protein